MVVVQLWCVVQEVKCGVSAPGQRSGMSGRGTGREGYAIDEAAKYPVRAKALKDRIIMPKL